jgi:transcriptional regulator with XRE-family HTH domain
MAKKNTRIPHADIVQRFTARLREMRVSRGLTQAELALKARVTSGYVGRLEAARVAPGIDLVDRLASALGSTVHDLLPITAAVDDRPILEANAIYAKPKKLKNATDN